MADALYGTIGGRLKIKAAVDSFYERVLADPLLRPYFEGFDMEGLRERQSMFVSMLLGGRVVYTGRNIHDAHMKPRKMGITEVHFSAFLRHFRAALEEVGVEREKLQEIMTLLEASRGQVLGT
jgi:hemoglobin